LRDRKEDIAPNIEYELERTAQRRGSHVQFNKEALNQFLKFATGPEGQWNGNFRDLGAAITRMSTLATGGRITVKEVQRELERLRRDWNPPRRDATSEQLEHILGAEAVEEIDPFDRVQLAEVIRVCQDSRNLSEAGRKLFAVSRTKRKSTNDADRLGKYLAKFGLDWKAVAG